ncbi:MAG: hypothetical protein M9894_20795 [Planctomycetes bacterium]|nr:hypothetical protein [Planctomycetota bacterium]
MGAPVAARGVTGGDAAPPVAPGRGGPARVIVAPAPPAPRGLECSIMLLLLPLCGLWNLAGLVLVGAGEMLARALGAPPALGHVMGLGTWALLLLGLGLLVHAHQTRWRGATLFEDRVVLGTVAPVRGVILRYDRLRGFRCRAGGVALMVRGRPWTRWLGPMIPCDEALMHDVVERLEARGVRRLDG